MYTVTLGIKQAIKPFIIATSGEKDLIYGREDKKNTT